MIRAYIDHFTMPNPFPILTGEILMLGLHDLLLLHFSLDEINGGHMKDLIDLHCTGAGLSPLAFLVSV